ncbi:MAG: glycosyltransferase family 2 protein [Polyangiaceae bacterium]
MLSVVIPALNEEAAIAETVGRIRAVLEKDAIVHEIIVVNDGSTDQTGVIARKCGARVVDHPVPGGYGLALKSGILTSSYELIAITDADGTYPCERIADLYRLVAIDGFDMAIGARTGSEYEGSFLKMPARRVFLWLSEYATGRKIDDINSGLRVFRKDIVLRYLATISDGFSFTTTITLAAMLNGYFVKYIPIAYYKRVGKSHVRYIRDTLRSLQIIVENIVFYNPLKLFLLGSSTLVVLAFVAVAGAVFARAYTTWAIGLVVLAALSIVGAVGIGSIGLAAVLFRRVAGSEGELYWRRRRLLRDGTPARGGDEPNSPSERERGARARPETT